jgi:glycosyltransferase involved in cell wall biosynthesis
VRCPTLAELPEPPSGKTGWPWTEESFQLPELMPDGCLWPRISVVTPSFNQGQFLEATIRSVLLQGYPDLEYFMLDGGSADNSVEIMTRYASWLTYWVSEPDSGQSEAINRGLTMASGSFATWINSDDMLHRNALVEHASRFGFDANLVYVGMCAYLHIDGTIASMHRGRVHSLEDLVSIRTVWRSQGHIVQPEVLFPRERVLAVGGLNTGNHNTMDYELWGKLLLTGVKFQYTDIPFGMFREHPQQKTMDGWRQTQSLLDTAATLVTCARCFSEETRDEILADLNAYREAYKKDQWRNSGRLTRMGLPSSMVIPLRNIRLKLQGFKKRFRQ